MKYPPYVRGTSESDLLPEAMLGLAASTSFLSIDTSSRVCRLESMSKMFCPGRVWWLIESFVRLMCSIGLRVGWCVGPSAIIAKFVIFNENTIQAPAGVSQVLIEVPSHASITVCVYQVIAMAMLNELGEEGLDRHVSALTASHPSLHLIVIRFAPFSQSMQFVGSGYSRLWTRPFLTLPMMSHGPSLMQECSCGSSNLCTPTLER